MLTNVLCFYYNNIIFQIAGFVNTRYCTLVNTSLIPMTFNLRVPADGWASEEGRSHENSLIDSNISDVGSTIMPSPREFDIAPSSGTIAPQGELDIKVTTSFHVRCICVFHGNLNRSWGRGGGGSAPCTSCTFYLQFSSPSMLSTWFPPFVPFPLQNITQCCKNVLPISPSFFLATFLNRAFHPLYTCPLPPLFFPGSNSLSVLHK